MGNATTLTKSESIWGSLVSDAKSRGCYFSWDANKDIDSTTADLQMELGQSSSLPDLESLHIQVLNYDYLLTLEYM